MPKVPLIQESVNRSSVVKVPLVKSENESIKESEKKGVKDHKLCAKSRAKREKEK